MAAPSDIYRTPLGSVRFQTVGVANANISDAAREKIIDDFIDSREQRSTESMLLYLYRHRSIGNDHVRGDRAQDTVKKTTKALR